MLNLKALMVGCASATVGASIAFAAPTTIDFSSDDGGNPLVNGQVISTGPDRQDQLGNPDSLFEFGNLINISTTQGSGGHQGAAIFDSDPAGPNAGQGDPDLDLLVGLGNILILQDNQRPSTTDTGTGANGLVFDTPDDEAARNSGSIVFDFLTPSEMLSIDIIDANGGFAGSVVLSDTGGKQRTYSIPSNFSFDINSEGPLGYETLDLATLANQLGEGGGTATASQDAGFDPAAVSTLEVFLSGASHGTSSSGIDNLVFIPEPSVLAVLGALGVLPLTRRPRRNG